MLALGKLEERRSMFCARLDAQESAERAGLRYVDDSLAGYERVRWGRGFSYRDWDGQTVSDRALRKYFVGLAIPPAWQAVWICRHRDAHLIATGRDNAGRKQYIYHDAWREARDYDKYKRLVGFGAALPVIRKNVADDLERDDLSRECVLAAVVRLLETTLVRIGGEQYAKLNDSYGLTTIRKRHVNTDEDQPRLEFVGKSAQKWDVTVSDEAVARVIRACQDVPGYELFKYFDGDGVKRDVTADDVNSYLQVTSGADITAKDFRTWFGTCIAWRELCSDTDASDRPPVIAAIEVVAEELGNTPAISRASYVHPDVIEGFDAGELNNVDAAKVPGLSDDEATLLRYLVEVELERNSGS